MNSRIYKYIFVFGVLMLGLSLNAIAQNKDKPTMKKAEVANSKENQEKTIKMLEERMQTASPEEKAKIQQKLDAYYGKNREHANDLSKSKEQIQEAYFKYEESERKLEHAKRDIEKSENELFLMEKENKISKEELAIRKQRLQKAKEELNISQEALKKQKEALKAKRMEMKKSEE